MSSIDNTLQSYFHFDLFQTGQQEAITSLVDGKDTLFVMPTGAGKSLIFQLTALQLVRLTIDISPLIALMKDQINCLNRCGIPAT